VVIESRVTWATSVPIFLVFLGLSVLDLGPMYATDRQTDRRQTSDVRQKHRLIPSPIRGGDIKSNRHAHALYITRDTVPQSFPLGCAMGHAASMVSAVVFLISTSNCRLLDLLS